MFGAPVSSAAADDHDWEIAGGYSRLRDARTDISFDRGWLLSISRRLGPVAVVVETDRSSTALPLVVGEATLSVGSVMGGVRASARVGPFREFAQLLVGNVRARGVLFGQESSDARLGVQPGVGLDYPFRDRYAARLAVDGRFLDSPQGPWRVGVRIAALIAYSFR